jgi:hypothetical protein
MGFVFIAKGDYEINNYMHAFHWNVKISEESQILIFTVHKLQ